MPRYDVSIIETGEKVVTVEAESREAAEVQVKRDYDAGEIVLMPGEDYYDVAFQTELSSDQVAQDMDILMVKCGKSPTHGRSKTIWKGCSRSSAGTSKFFT